MKTVLIKFSDDTKIGKNVNRDSKVKQSKELVIEIFVSNQSTT